MNTIIAHIQMKADVALTPVLSSERSGAACFYAGERNVLKPSDKMHRSSPLVRYTLAQNIGGTDIS